MSAAFKKLLDLEQQYRSHATLLPDNNRQAVRQDLVLFDIAKTRYAIVSKDLAGLVLWPKISPIPGTVPWFLGLTNVNNKLITVSDLSGFMYGELIAANTRKYLLLFNYQDLNAGVIVNNLLKTSCDISNDIQQFAIAKLIEDPRFMNVRG